jgi:hypothetical protein
MWIKILEEIRKKLIRINDKKKQRNPDFKRKNLNFRKTKFKTLLRIRTIKVIVIRIILKTS